MCMPRPRTSVLPGCTLAGCILAMLPLGKRLVTSKRESPGPMNLSGRGAKPYLETIPLQ